MEWPIRVHYFPNVFLGIFHSSVAFMSIYCSYTSVAKLIARQKSYCMEQKEQVQEKDALLYIFPAQIPTKPTTLFPEMFLGAHHSHVSLYQKIWCI